MSLSFDGQSITCDGDGCHARVKVPVGLRQTLRGAGDQTATVSGWLYVARGGSVKHYCPNCKPRYLDILARTGVSNSVKSTGDTCIGE